MTNYGKFYVDKSVKLHCVEFVKREVKVLPMSFKRVQQFCAKGDENVTKMIHWELCGVNGLDRADKWYKDQPQSVLETDKIKVFTLWFFNIQCDHIIKSRRPDILVLWGKQNRVC